ncbi:MAG: flagellar hook-length control protein FliK [Deltaproteobacteria bacterium]|nr:flagellar hook-length control protein FliK [Deltaproteobacteria bacterium]
MTAEINQVQQIQESDPLGASEKVKRGSSGGQTGDLLPFACIMGDAVRTVSREAGELHAGLPGAEGMQGQPDTKKASRQGEDDAAGSKAGLEAERCTGNKTNRSLPVSEKGVAEHPHKTAPKGGETKDPALPAHGSEDGGGEKGLKPSVHVVKGDGMVKGSEPSPGVPEKGETAGNEAVRSEVTGNKAMRNLDLFATVSKEKTAQTGGSVHGNTVTPPQKDSHPRIGAEVQALPKSDILGEGRTERMHLLKGVGTEQTKPGVRRAGFQVETSRPETAGTVVGKGEAPVTGTDTMKIGPADKDAAKNTKITATVLSNSGGTKGDEYPRVTGYAAESLKTGVRQTDAAKGKITVSQNEGNETGKGVRPAEGSPEPKTNLMDAAAVKGKNSSEKGGAEKAPASPARDGGGGDIGNKPDLKAEVTAGGDETARVRKSADRTAGTPHRDTVQSAPVSDRGVPAGGYQQTALHVGGRPAIVPEHVEITPRMVIDQIAEGAKMSGRVRIALNPPTLGTLDMDVMVRDNKVHVILQAESSDVKQILQSHMDSLKVSLRSQGLVADTIQVFAPEKSDGSGYYESGRDTAWFGEGSNDNRSRNERGWDGGDADFSGPVSSMPEEEPRRVAGDGRLSVFA